MLNNKQKKQLKAIANTIDTKYQVGKQEITDTLLDMLDKALEAKELIKIDVLKSAEAPTMQIALDIASKLNATLIQVIGRKATLYRESKNHIIKLVK